MLSDIAKSCSVLVIDDDLVAVELTKRVLTHAGFHTVASTNNPTLARTLMRDLKPHVVILDLNMPELDGFSVIESLRDDARRIGTSIIMVTGETDQDVQATALRQGASDFVTKPFVAAVLVARVAGAAEMRELQRQLSDRNARLQQAVSVRTSRLQDALGVLTRAESELKRSLDAETFAEFAHELRTPLTAVCGFADALRRQQGGTLPPPALELAEDIYGAATHVQRVVDGFFDLIARPGDATLDVAETDLAALAGESLKLLSPQAEAGGVDLRLDVKPGLASLRTDRTKLAQIVLDLGADTVTRTPSAGRAIIEIGPAADGGCYIIVVGDPAGANGPAADGHALTRRYVEALGGSFSIDPSTAMIVRLPATPPGAVDGARAPS